LRLLRRIEELPSHTISEFEFSKEVATMTLDLEGFEKTPPTQEPFEYLAVPEFVKSELREAINNDFPKVWDASSFPLSKLTFGPKFKELIEDLNSPEFRAAFERRFSIDLADRTHDDHRARSLLRKGWKNPHRLEDKDHYGAALYEFDLGRCRRTATHATIGK
jgi:hypothetical protein